ncbi:MAG: TauD/TfdA dioxygenase family protein [Solimonas sp.]
MKLGILKRMPVGVEIDADLRDPLSADDRERLRGLLYQHGLLLFRGQRLSHPQQIAVMDGFGPVLHARDGIGYISTDAGKGSLGTGELAFHSDLSFTTHPFLAISLHATDVVDGGSSTRFASGTGGYARLSAERRRQLAGLSVLCAMPVDMSTDRLSEVIAPAMPQHWRPAILRHPVTDEPILYVNQQHAARLGGMADEQSAALLRELFAILYAPENVYEHRWHNGDLLIWDNLILQHARGDLQSSGRRTLQRVVVAEKSFFDLCPQIDVNDPDYQRWNKSSNPAADRHLIESVVARGARRLALARQ